MNAREERRAAFNEQMNEWVSRQGLWFQLRHAADGQTIMARMARVALRLALLVVFAALIFWIYLVKRVESDGFRERIQTSIEQSLKGADCELGVIRKERDVASISSIEMKGTARSFFHSLKIRQARLNMELTDGLFGQWNGGGISVDVLDMFVKAGASDNAGAAASYSSLFDDHGSFSYEWIEADKANIRWGYSENNRGSIKGSHMSAAREGTGWRMEFKGGTFSQNWINDLQIVKMVVICDKAGVHFKEAELHSGGGTLSFKLNMGSGGQPQASGIVTLKSMPVKTLLPTRYHDLVEGVISGKGTVSGSTNSQEGIVMDIDLSLDDGDVMVLRDNLPLLSALSVVDLYNSYRKVSFTEGGCHIRTGGNVLTVTGMNLQASDLLYLGGDLTVRPPSYKEIAEALHIKDVQSVKDVIEENWKMDDELLESSESNTSVADAAKGVGEVVEGNANAKPGSAEEVKKTSILAEQRVRRFGGVVKVGLKPDAFDKAPRLKEAYPMDASTGRIWVDVPLQGRLQTLTLELAERLYVLGRNRR
ncbi:MAG: hypothetical protein H7A51_05240 [Akkermansiaceae bacterium]|nr:hypothetical protein [Akkermansiaceae bacterium]